MKLKSLDKKDKRILLALDMDARKSDSMVAKAIGLSKQATNYRIRRLEKRGIIRSYYAVIDHTKLGLKLFRIALKLENAGLEKEQEILTYLKRHAGWMVSTLGPWDIWMAVYAKDEYGLMGFLRELQDRFGFFIAEEQVSLMTTFWNYERSFIYPSKKDRRRVFVLGDRPGPERVDEVDERILREMAVDARRSTTDLARKLGISERTARYRLKRLEGLGIILGYRPFVDTISLGFKYFKILVDLKDAGYEDLARIRSHIVQDPHVVYGTEALGGDDIEIEAQFLDSQELFAFMAGLKRAFPGFIKEVRHAEYVMEHKVAFYPGTGPAQAT